MTDTFADRIDELRAQVGDGLLHGQINFDQVYARYVDGWGDLGDDTGVITPTEESHGPNGKPGPSFDHPRGGEAGYLTATLTRIGPSIAQAWADSIGEETPLDNVMIHQVEDVTSEAEGLAPREFWLLSGSGHPSVESDGSTIYDRPPLIGRAPEDLLQAMKRSPRGLDIEHENGNHRRHSDLSPNELNLFGGGRA
jgi:hypothetical protein